MFLISHVNGSTAFIAQACLRCCCLTQVMDVCSVTDYEYHVRVCDGYAWDHLPRSEWDAHADDTCPLSTCRRPRFKSQAAIQHQSEA